MIAKFHTPRWFTLMTTWRSFLSWKLKTPFLITAKSLLWGDSSWWPPEGAKGAYMTAKSLRQADPPWWPPKRVFCPESCELSSWSEPSLCSVVTHLDDQLKELKELIWQPSFYAKMTHLDDHLKEFLVLKVEDSLLADWESLLGELHGKFPGGNKETWILHGLWPFSLYFLLYTDNSSECLAIGAIRQGTTSS